MTLLEPPGIPFLFNRLGLVRFCKFRHEASILRKNALHSTGFCRKFHLQPRKTQSTCKPVRYVLIISVLFFSAVASEAKWNVVIHENRRYVPLEDVASFYKMNMPATSGERFRLEAPGRSIEGADSGRNVYVNGVKYVLCFPIASKDGRTLISAMDVVKIIEPILLALAVRPAGLFGR